MCSFESLEDLFNFGKFKGCSLGEVLMFSPDYVCWVNENVSGEICIITDSAIEEIKLIFPSFEITEEFETLRNRNLDAFDMAMNDDCDYEETMYSDGSQYCGYSGCEDYGEFDGTYAKDVAGYSDDEIWDIFDGEPDAYWNID